MLYQSCWNNPVTGLIVPSSLLQFVNSLFQTCSNKSGTSSANTSCQQLVNRLVTTCLKVCSNLCVFTCVPEVLGRDIHIVRPFDARYMQNSSSKLLYGSTQNFNMPPPQVRSQKRHRLVLSCQFYRLFATC